MGNAVEKWAKRVASSPMMVAEFDPVTIITILSALLPIFAKMCGGDKSPELLQRKAANMLRKGKTQPNAKQIKAMNKAGVPVKKQNALWLSVLCDAATSHPADFETAAKGVPWDDVLV